MENDTRKKRRSEECRKSEEQIREYNIRAKKRRADHPR